MIFWCHYTPLRVQVLAEPAERVHGQAPSEARSEHSYHAYCSERSERRDRNNGPSMELHLEDKPRCWREAWRVQREHQCRKQSHFL